jgi:eukaryotic-like serine/threonine-protein kinase
VGLPTQAEDPGEHASARSGTRSTAYAAGQIVASRYRLIRKLGEGGMGVVWVAHSLVLGVDVAIKLIRAGAGDSDLASRMAREAQVTATLGHPAIVRVFDFGTTDDGAPFLVMELAQGETLADEIDRERKLGAVEALKLVLPIVDGLRCAHERGIVHRDIKPENVFIARDPLGRLQPKLLDFGIAKLEALPDVSRLTQVGVVLGSPEYMSPEQARGVGSVDARTDVWALCVVLYEMLTGTVPFKVDNYNALMQAILHEPPLPTVEYGAGDRELWSIIAKGLEKSRDKRWASMTELGEALAFWLVDHGVTEDIAGNSLRAVWLGGTLTGVSLRVVNWRHRAGRAFKPNIVAGLGAGVILATIALSIAAWKPREIPKVASVASASARPAAPPVVAPPMSTPLPSASSSPAAATSSKHLNRSPAHAAPPPQTTRHPAGQRSTTKSIRDFGF